MSIKRVYTETECEESETTDDLSIPVIPSRKISKGSKEEEHPVEESKTDSVDEENAGDLTKETNTEVSEVDKNDTEEVQSPKDVAEQGIVYLP